MRPWLDRRFSAALGLTLLTAALSRYTSEHPAVLRWSLTYGAVILFFAALAALAWLRSWRLARATAAAMAPSAILRDLAILAWGVASLLSALASPVHAGDILGGNVIGFEYPAATLISWLILPLLLAAILTHDKVLALLRRRPATLSLATVAVLLVSGEGITRGWAVIAPEVQGFPTHRTAMWLARFAPRDGAGLRDGPHAAGDNHRRLLVVGDSYAFGWGIEKQSDRLGEQLAAILDSATGEQWDSYNVSAPDLDTRQELALLQSLPAVHPDVALVIYVFNDMDYLTAPLTERTVLTEAPTGMLDRLNPARAIFLNSFLFQELYVRARHARLRLAGGPRAAGPYADTILVARHLQDVSRLVRYAAGDRGVGALVPLDIAPLLDTTYARRMSRFVRQAQAAGIPVIPVDSAFAGHSFSDLAVNALDAHPNEQAHHLAARWLAVHGGLRRPP